DHQSGKEEQILGQRQIEGQYRRLDRRLGARRVDDGDAPTRAASHLSNRTATRGDGVVACHVGHEVIEERSVGAVERLAQIGECVVNRHIAKTAWKASDRRESHDEILVLRSAWMRPAGSGYGRLRPSVGSGRLRFVLCSYRYAEPRFPSESRVHP